MRADQLVLSAAAQEAVKRFRSAKPWRGTFADRKEKFETFHAELNEACGFETGLLIVGEIDETRRGNGGYHAESNQIILACKLSVVTYLYGFALAAGLGRPEALTWARELFAQYFPRSFARCRIVEGCVISDGTNLN